MRQSTRRDGLLFLIGCFDDHGGLQRRIGDLADILARRRPVTILTWAGPRLPRCSRRASGARVVRLPSLGGWGREYRFPARHADAAISVTAGLAAAIGLRHSWGTAYASGLSGEGLVAALAAPLLGRNFFLESWLSGERGSVARLERSPLRGPLKRALRRATGVVGGTDEVAQELLRCGFPAPRVRVVPHGIRLGEFVPATEEARRLARRELGVAEDVGLVVYHGRFDLRQKRLDLLLEGWRRAELEGWRLLLVGEGRDRPDLERLRRRTPSVLPLAGWRDDVRPVLAAADLFVLPTEAEAPGAAMLEGMAAGLAGAVSAIPLYRRLAPAGIEVVPNQSEAWAEALRRLAADPEDRAERGTRARRWVEENCDIRDTVAMLESLFEER